MCVSSPDYLIEKSAYFKSNTVLLQKNIAIRIASGFVVTPHEC